MKPSLKKSTYLPALLAVYLIVMATIGRGLATTKPLEYYAVLAISAGVIVLLHFTLRKKERLAERKNDPDNNENTKQNEQS
ncbi:MAG: hypothetical protein SPJ71_00290 [Candidatus Limisoma sp.]|nr:hypothetical protein [Bacteroidales bacterium]MDY5893000.1 hypothetical protein [Candidatus Limisoma sp.]